MTRTPVVKEPSEEASKPSTSAGTYAEKLISTVKDVGSFARAIRLWMTRTKPTTTELLLTCFQIKGKPYTLKDHFLFRPLYALDRPRRRLLKLARQMGKSFAMCTSEIILAAIIEKHYRSLFICPRFEQSKRLSSQIVSPLLSTTLIKDACLDTACVKSVLRRQFKGNSDLLFSYAFLDPERIRSLSGICTCSIDEVQDFNFDFLPVVQETMSGRPDHGYFNFAGTPKSFDNTLERLWRKTSQSEWVTKCSHCNHFNIASVEFDLLKMIGKKTCCCSRCGKPLDCSTGRYIARFQDKVDEFEGLHAPQIVHPSHYNYPMAWKELLRKVNGAYSPQKLYNEVFGESFDSTERLMTESDLSTACGTHINSLDNIEPYVNSYDPLCLAVDWTGGGVDGKSFTSIALCGRKVGSDRIDVLYGQKFPLHSGPMEQIAAICNLYQRIRKKLKAGVPLMFAHDFRGVGYVFHANLLTGGIPPNAMVPFNYVNTPRQEVVYEVTTDLRTTISIDKPRSLLTLCHMIKAGKVRFPELNSQKSDTCNGDPISYDFLHLFSETTERATGSDIFLIHKQADTSDDFAHAVNFGCSAIWFYQQEYPTIEEASRMRLTVEDFLSINPLAIHPDTELSVEDWMEQDVQ